LESELFVFCFCCTTCSDIIAVAPAIQKKVDSWYIMQQQEKIVVT